MKQELVFRFHNPNTEKATYNALMKVFTEVGCKKLKEAITKFEKIIQTNFQQSLNDSSSPRTDICTGRVYFLKQFQLIAH